MKYNHFVLAASLYALSSCGVSNSSSTSTSSADSASHADRETTLQKGPQGVMMMIRDTITAGDPLELKFIVVNNSDTIQQFLKWDTPFEPLVSKYLDVKDADGTQVNYRGAMAKRAMPPSADSYVKVNPGDSLVATINLLDGYAITGASKYTVSYVGSNISGITVRDSVSFVYR